MTPQAASSRNASEHPEELAEELVVHDRRRIDPKTGAIRTETGAAKPSPRSAGKLASSSSPRMGNLETQLAERTADLQRLQAEYVNYRRRVDRDREKSRQVANVNLLTELLPVLDDIGRAREHGELEGGFKSVAESLETIAAKLGLEQFGTPGDVFDPTVHEALTHIYTTEVAEPTATEIFQPGYRVGARVIRPARVSVAEPDPTGGLASSGNTPTAPRRAEPDTSDTP